jgi:hypothetical protein
MANSTWQEAIDVRRGRHPFVTETDTTITFQLGILGGVMRTELFVPTPRTRLAICCDRDGEITARILEGKSSCS